MTSSQPLSAANFLSALQSSGGGLSIIDDANDAPQEDLQPQRPLLSDAEVSAICDSVVHISLDNNNTNDSNNNNNFGDDDESVVDSDAPGADDDAELRRDPFLRHYRIRRRRIATDEELELGLDPTEGPPVLDALLHYPPTEMVAALLPTQSVGFLREILDEGLEPDDFVDTVSEVFRDAYPSYLRATADYENSKLNQQLRTQLRAFFAEVDANDNGNVDWEEFSTHLLVNTRGAPTDKPGRAMERSLLQVERDSGFDPPPPGRKMSVFHISTQPLHAIRFLRGGPPPCTFSKAWGCHIVAQETGIEYGVAAQVELAAYKVSSAPTPVHSITVPQNLVPQADRALRHRKLELLGLSTIPQRLCAIEPLDENAAPEGVNLRRPWLAATTSDDRLLYIELADDPLTLLTNDGVGQLRVARNQYLPGRHNILRWNAIGKFLAAADTRGRVKLIDPTDTFSGLPREILSFHGGGKTDDGAPGTVSDIACMNELASCDKLIIAGSDNLRMVDTARGGEVLHTLGERVFATRLAYSGEAQLVAACVSGDPDIHLLTPHSSGKSSFVRSLHDPIMLSGPLRGLPKQVVALEGTPYITSYDTAGVIRLWDLRSSVPVCAFRSTGEDAGLYAESCDAVPLCMTRSVAVDPVALELSTVSRTVDGSRTDVYRMKLTDARDPMDAHDSDVLCVEFVDDMRQLASIATDDTVHFWEGKSMVLRRRIKEFVDGEGQTAVVPGRAKRPVTACNIELPNGRRTFIGLATGEVFLYSTVTRCEIAEFPSHSAQVVQLAINLPDRVVSGGADGVIYVNSTSEDLDYRNFATIKLDCAVTQLCCDPACQLIFALDARCKFYEVDADPEGAYFVLSASRAVHAASATASAALFKAEQEQLKRAAGGGGGAARPTSAGDLSSPSASRPGTAASDRGAGGGEFGERPGTAATSKTDTSAASAASEQPPQDKAAAAAAANAAANALESEYLNPTTFEGTCCLLCRPRAAAVVADARGYLSLIPTRPTPRHGEFFLCRWRSYTSGGSDNLRGATLSVPTVMLYREEQQNKEEEEEEDEDNDDENPENDDDPFGATDHSSRTKTRKSSRCISISNNNNGGGERTNPSYMELIVGDDQGHIAVWDMTATFCSGKIGIANSMFSVDPDSIPLPSHTDPAVIQDEFASRPQLLRHFAATEGGMPISAMCLVEKRNLLVVASRAKIQLLRPGGERVGVVVQGRCVGFESYGGLLDLRVDSDDDDEDDNKEDEKEDINFDDADEDDPEAQMIRAEAARRRRSSIVPAGALSISAAAAAGSPSSASLTPPAVNSPTGPATPSASKRPPSPATSTGNNTKTSSRRSSLFSSRYQQEREPPSREALAKKELEDVLSAAGRAHHWVAVPKGQWENTLGRYTSLVFTGCGDIDANSAKASEAAAARVTVIPTRTPRPSPTRRSQFKKNTHGVQLGAHKEEIGAGVRRVAPRRVGVTGAAAAAAALASESTIVGGGGGGGGLVSPTSSKLVLPAAAVAAEVLTTPTKTALSNSSVRRSSRSSTPPAKRKEDDEKQRQDAEEEQQQQVMADCFAPDAPSDRDDNGSDDDDEGIFTETINDVDEFIIPVGRQNASLTSVPSMSPMAVNRALSPLPTHHEPGNSPGSNPLRRMLSGVRQLDATESVGSYSPDASMRGEAANPDHGGGGGLIGLVNTSGGNTTTNTDRRASTDRRTSTASGGGGGGLAKRIQSMTRSSAGGGTSSGLAASGRFKSMREATYSAFNVEDTGFDDSDDPFGVMLRQVAECLIKEFERDRIYSVNNNNASSSPPASAAGEGDMVSPLQSPMIKGTSGSKPPTSFPAAASFRIGGTTLSSVASGTGFGSIMAAAQKLLPTHTHAIIYHRPLLYPLAAPRNATVLAVVNGTTSYASASAYADRLEATIAERGLSNPQLPVRDVVNQIRLFAAARGGNNSTRVWTIPLTSIIEVEEGTRHNLAAAVHDYWVQKAEQQKVGSRNRRDAENKNNDRKENSPSRSGGETNQQGGGGAGTSTPSTPGLAVGSPAAHLLQASRGARRRAGGGGLSALHYGAAPIVDIKSGAVLGQVGRDSARTASSIASSSSSRPSSSAGVVQANSFLVSSPLSDNGEPISPFAQTMRPSAAGGAASVLSFTLQQQQQSAESESLQQQSTTKKSNKHLHHLQHQEKPAHFGDAEWQIYLELQHKISDVQRTREQEAQDERDREEQQSMLMQQRSRVMVSGVFDSDGAQLHHLDVEEKAERDAAAEKQRRRQLAFQSSAFDATNAYQQSRAEQLAAENQRQAVNADSQKRDLLSKFYVREHALKAAAAVPATATGLTKELRRAGIVKKTRVELDEEANTLEAVLAEDKKKREQELQQRDKEQAVVLMKPLQALRSTPGRSQPPAGVPDAPRHLFTLPLSMEDEEKKGRRERGWREADRDTASIRRAAAAVGSGAGSKTPPPRASKKI